MVLVLPTGYHTNISSKMKKSIKRTCHGFLMLHCSSTPFAFSMYSQSKKLIIFHLVPFLRFFDLSSYRVNIPRCLCFVGSLPSKNILRSNLYILNFFLLASLQFPTVTQLPPLHEKSNITTKNIKRLITAGTQMTGKTICLHL